MSKGYTDKYDLELKRILKNDDYEDIFKKLNQAQKQELERNFDNKNRSDNDYYFETQLKKYWVDNNLMQVINKFKPITDKHEEFIESLNPNDLNIFYYNAYKLPDDEIEKEFNKF